MDNSLTILSIEKFKGSTYCVELSESDTIYLHSSIISQFNLRNGTSLSEDALSQVVYANDYRKAKERALYLLEYRDHSYKELFTKLKKNYSEEVCNDVMNKMLELSLIDDAKYAQMYARHLFEVKRMGKYRAKFEMQKKGIDKELIDEMIFKYENSTQSRLYELVEKKYARYLCDEKGIKKVTSALSRQGYSYSDIRDTLRKYIDEEEY